MWKKIRQDSSWVAFVVIHNRGIPAHQESEGKQVIHKGVKAEPAKGIWRAQCGEKNVKWNQGFQYLCPRGGGGMAAAWFANTTAPPRHCQTTLGTKTPQRACIAAWDFCSAMPRGAKKMVWWPGEKKDPQTACQAYQAIGLPAFHGFWRRQNPWNTGRGKPAPHRFFFRGAPSVGRPPWAHRGAQAKGMQGKNPRGAQARRPQAPNTRRDCGFAGVHLASRIKAHGNLLSGAVSTRPERRKTETMRKVAPPQRPLSDRGA